MRRWIICVTVLLLAAFRVTAQETAAAGDILPFLRIDRNPVTTGMAGAGLSSTAPGTDFAYATFGNGAAVPFMDKRFAFGVSYQMRSPSEALSDRVQGGFALKAGKVVGLTAGFSWGQMRMPLYGGDFRPSDLLVGGGISVAAARCFSLGANFKYALQQYPDKDKLGAFSVDLLAQFHGKDFNVLLGAVGIGPKVQAGADYEKYSQPASVKLAGDYVFHFSIMSLQLALDADYYFSKNYSVAGGFQFGVKDWVYFRGGYRYASRNCVIPSHLSLGLSGGYAGVTLSLSYLTLSKELGNTWLIGLGYSF